MFITTLHALSERCNFGEMKDELIRERTVIGFKDSELSEKFQVDLTLMKAISQARSYQKAANTFSEWFKESTDIKRDVDAVNAKRSPNKFKKELYSSSRKNRKKPPSPSSINSRRTLWETPSHARQTLPGERSNLSLIQHKRSLGLCLQDLSGGRNRRWWCHPWRNRNRDR